MTCTQGILKTSSALQLSAPVILNSSCLNIPQVRSERSKEISSEMRKVDQVVSKDIGKRKPDQGFLL